MHTCNTTPVSKHARPGSSAGSEAGGELRQYVEKKRSTSPKVYY